MYAKDNSQRSAPFDPINMQVDDEMIDKHTQGLIYYRH